MKRISLNANLSKQYTAHCIRTTVVTNMFNSGHSVSDIQCVTGHRNADSVKRYLRRVGDDKKIEFSKTLSKTFNKDIHGENKMEKQDQGY